MKDEMNFDNLEDFLQAEVNNQKMFPSDRVWNNIAKEVQPKKSWPALTAISLFVVLSLGIATSIYYPPKTNLLSNVYVSSLDKTINKSITVTNNHRSVNTTGILSKQNILQTESFIGINSAVQKLAKNNLFKEIGKQGKKFASISVLETNVRQASIVPTRTFKNDKVGNENIVRNLLLKSTPSVTVVVNSIPKQLSSSIVSHYGNHTTINRPKLPNTVQYEIYTTPTRSYRTLQNDQVLSQISSSNTSNVNSNVNQKAGLGSELGLGVRYRMSENITFKTGLQFNIRQYSIDAYKTSNGLATIQVVQNNKIETLGIASSYSNSSAGVSETKLDNKLYQISIPIGIEWNLYAKKKLGVSVAASLQPTYSLNRNVYIISTDYKYYANGESLFRKWNINSCINANFNYNIKGATITFGPQIRYQHLSTFVDKYPIKEYRLDYGLRLGVIKTLK